LSHHFPIIFPGNPSLHHLSISKKTLASKKQARLKVRDDLFHRLAAGWWYTYPSFRLGYAIDSWVITSTYKMVIYCCLMGLQNVI
jgi:hypothetical protein